MATGPTGFTGFTTGVAGSTGTFSSEYYQTIEPVARSRGPAGAVGPEIERKEEIEPFPPIKPFLFGKKTHIDTFNKKGFVILEDIMPSSTFSSVRSDRTTADFAIAEMARTSYGKLEASEKEKTDEPLIHYLMEHLHTSPFEGVKFKFVIQCPISVTRQIIRHRMANVNEYSMRYSDPIEEFYYPEIRLQDLVNRQGSVEVNEKSLSEEEKKNLEEAKGIYNSCIQLNMKVFELVKELNKKGVAKEVSRYLLPVAEMTKFYFVMDLHNLFHFLQLRMDVHTQKETREVACAMYELIKPIVPVACAAFEKYRLNAVKYSSVEMKLLPFCFSEGRVIPRDLFDRLPQIISIKKNKEMTDRQISTFYEKILKSTK